MDDYLLSCRMILIILFIVSKFLSGKCSFKISTFLYFEQIYFFFSYNYSLKTIFCKATFFSRTPIKILIKETIRIFKINIYNNYE